MLDPHERLIRPTKSRKFNILHHPLGLISVAHQAILCLSYVKKGIFRPPFFLFNVFTRFSELRYNLNRFFLNLLAMFFTEEAFE